MYFTFNNASSRDFNIKIKKSNHLSIPKRKREFIEVQGRTDNLIVDEGCRDMLDLQIEAYIDCRPLNTRDYSLRLDNWLNGPDNYTDIAFDDGTVLKAIFVGQIDFDEVVKNFNEILLQFKAYRECDL